MKQYDPIINVNGQAYERIMIKTHVIVKGEDIGDLLVRYVQPLLQPGDIIFVGEKATSASQGRAIPLSEIKPSPLARFLVRFVKKASYGIGLGMAETMEMAIREVGAPRIILAAIIGGIFKIFGVHGMFYNIAGHKARSIDGPADYVIPPYNRCVVLGVADADDLCRKASAKVGAPVAVVDANDIGLNVIGISSPDLRNFPFKQVLKDNPAGQTTESTPFGIIRAVPARAAVRGV
jgi:hypothetical protein